MKNSLKKFIFFCIVLCISLTFTAVTKAEKTTIKISGSTTVLPVIVKASEKITANSPDFRITVNPGGSGVGIKSLGNGLVDIGLISRQITDEELKYFSNIDFNKHVIGKDAVACVISSEIYNAGVKSLTKEDIRRIYSNDIVNWKEVGGPDKRIFCIDKERHRGTRHVFMEYIFGNKKAKAPGADLVCGSNNEEQTKIALSNTAIGMLSFAWINDDVKGVGIRVDDMVIEPTIANVKNGTYPITRDLTLITNGEPKGAASVFIDYLLTSAGQNIVEEQQYVTIK